jgi:hypothetical protein
LICLSDVARLFYWGTLCHLGAVWRISELTIDSVTRITSVMDLAVRMGIFFPWPTLNLRRGIGMFPRPRACPWVGGTPLLPKCHTQGMTVYVFVLPYFLRPVSYVHCMKPRALLGGGC